MAIYFNLAIDCGEDEESADAALQHFEGFFINLSELPPAECEVWKAKVRERWFVGVWPKGMGYATLPISRPELMQAPNLKIIRVALNERLLALTGYRRARFGDEAWDFFVDSSPEEDDDIDYIHMVFSSKDFSQPPKGSTIAPFAEGYAIVIKQERQRGNDEQIF